MFHWPRGYHHILVFLRVEDQERIAAVGTKVSQDRVSGGGIAISVLLDRTFSLVDSEAALGVDNVGAESAP